jgi:hypothetical protein
MPVLIVVYQVPSESAQDQLLSRPEDYQKELVPPKDFQFQLDQSHKVLDHVVP